MLAPPVGEVTVVGPAPSSLKQVRSDVLAVTGAHEGQIARFEGSVCPGVLGAPDDARALLIQEMRDLLREAHVAASPAGCRPNLLLILSGDGAAFIHRVTDAHGELFRSMTRSEIRRLQDWPGPAWSWQGIAPERFDGGPLEPAADGVRGSSAPGCGGGGGYVVRNAPGSRLVSSVRQDVVISYVVVSTPSAAKATLRQVADFAVLSGLTVMRHDGWRKLTSPSILTVFDDLARAAPPRSGATSFDVAYLRSLYASTSGRTRSQQAEDIAYMAARHLRAGSAPAAAAKDAPRD